MRQVVSDAILAAAEEVLAERGAHAASVGEIAARAGVAVGTVYNHFADRTALVQALYRARREEISPRLAELLAAGQGLPFEARFRQFLHGVAALFERYRAFARVALETEHLRPAVTAPRAGAGGRPHAVLVRLHDCLLELLRLGMEQGAVPAGDPELAARVACGALRAVVQRAVAEHRPFTDGIDQVVDLLLHGVTLR